MTDKLNYLVAQLQAHPTIQKNEELSALCLQITHELTLTNPETNNASALVDSKSGCYIFEGVSGFFCPNCFDNRQQRINTKRLNSKLRVCPQCRSSITPQ
jgi:predicted RNA-binding Zn-ribbon protein involved in translation (DUF1610 family)